MEGLIAISPYTGVIRTFASIRVNTQKRRHGLGMRAFACVVGANWNSPTFQIRHVTIRPYCKSPYAVACVFPSIHPHFKFVPTTNRPHSKFAPIPNHPCYKSPPFQMRPCFQLPPFQIALGIKNSKKVFYYKNKFVSLPPWKKYMSCNTHSWLHSVLGIVLSWRLCLFVYIL